MDRIVSIRVKVERAKKHIIDAKDAVRAFFDSKPYAVLAKQDAQSRKLIYYLDRIDDVPASIALVTGDTIQNLRSALDYLAWQLVLANGQIPDRSTAFPIAETVEKFEAALPARVKGMSSTAIDLVRAAKPYKGGNDLLWALHELNNIDKHRLLLTVWHWYESVDLTAFWKRTYQKILKKPLPDFADIFDGRHPVGKMVKTGDVLFTDAVEREVDKDMNFAFNVTLDEPHVPRSQPLAETLDELLHVVDEIVTRFEPLL